MGPHSPKEAPEAKTLISIIPEIVRITSPEKILLISASFSHNIIENVFVGNTIEEYMEGHYNLLILTDYKNKSLAARLELMMLAWLSGHRNLQLHLMDIYEFNKKVVEGDEYSISILSKAFICYDKEKIPLEYPGRDYFARA